MRKPPKETIDMLLMRNIPRELVMAVEEALVVGALRASEAAKGMDAGHHPHVLGQMRHFHMNEAFHTALVTSASSTTPIRGNSVISGRSGLFSLGRFNASGHIWFNARRSKTRQQMSLANRAIEPLVQPGLFENYQEPANATAFFVGCFSGGIENQSAATLSIHVAVPDKEMKGWLFREDISRFLARYDSVITVQEDKAMPSLKRGAIKRVVEEN